MHIDESSGRQTSCYKLQLGKIDAIEQPAWAERSCNYERTTQSNNSLGPNTHARCLKFRWMFSTTVLPGSTRNYPNETYPLCRSGTSSVITPVRSTMYLSLTSCWMSKILILPAISPTAMFSSLCWVKGFLKIPYPSELCHQEMFRPTSAHALD